VFAEKEEKRKGKEKKSIKEAVTHCKKSLTELAAKHEEKRPKMSRDHKAIS